MPSGKRIVQNYEELAELTQQRGDAQMRDRFLILAADAALSINLRDDAERLRARLLELNPHHLLRPYPSLREALKSPDVSSYLGDLRHTYPPDEAFRLLESLRSSTAPATSEVPASVEPAPIPEPETLQIYNFAEMENEATAAVEPLPEKPAAKPRSLERPVSQAEDTAPLVETPEVFPYPVETPLPRRRRPRSDEADEPPSAVSVGVSTTLFGLMLVAVVALLVYTLARPFFSL